MPTNLDFMLLCTLFIHPHTIYPAFIPGSVDSSKKINLCKFIFYDFLSKPQQQLHSKPFLGNSIDFLTISSFRISFDLNCRFMHTEYSYTLHHNSCFPGRVTTTKRKQKYTQKSCWLFIKRLIRHYARTITAKARTKIRWHNSLTQWKSTSIQLT